MAPGFGDGDGDRAGGLLDRGAAVPLAFASPAGVLVINVLADSWARQWPWFGAPIRRFPPATHHVFWCPPPQVHLRIEPLHGGGREASRQILDNGG